MVETVKDIEAVDIHQKEHARLFLLFYTFEAWEKLLQIRAFVQSPEHRRKKRKQAIIKNFLTALDSVAREFSDGVVPYCMKLEALDPDDFGPDEFDEFVEVVRFVRHVVHALLQFHEKLESLAGEGKAESQITYDFVRKLAVDTQSTSSRHWLPYVPSIALTGDYNFTEHGLLQILSNILENSSLEPLPPQGHDVVLMLPKAESENPLMWAIVAHETAHTMIAQFRILDEILKSTDEDLSAADPAKCKKYASWAEEVCADFIALRLLGPSYYFSFASMAILLEPQRSVATHPAPALRLGMMESIIDRHYPGWNVNCPTQDTPLTQTGLVPLFRELVDYKEMLWRSQGWSNNARSHRSSFEMTTESIRFDKDVIFDVLDYVHVPTAQFVDQAQLNDIYHTMLTGQPVSSWERVGFDKEVFVRRLDKARVPDDVYTILPPPEDPLTLSSIISSGWMLKVYHDYSNLWKEVQRSGSLYATLENYSRVIHRRNLMLQTSLNRSFMMQMYWQWKEVV